MYFKDKWRFVVKNATLLDDYVNSSKVLFISFHFILQLPSMEVILPD